LIRDFVLPTDFIMADSTNCTISTHSLACKFGGTSLADASQIRKIAAIVRSDARRRYVVVSAPGKRHSSDKKVTDLLYLCHHTMKEELSAGSIFALIRERYEEIGRELEVEGVSGWLDAVEAEMSARTEAGLSADWIASRGEYLHGRLIAAFLGAAFVDAAELIRFTPDGRLDPVSYELTRLALESHELAVIPGFYGRDAGGRIKTFSRGGSDVTGAIVARAMAVEAYENWTDVDGLMMADPRLIPDPRPIREVTYQELRELSYMGASVLHDEAVFPVRQADIPIHIRNTNAPDMPGTWIRPTRPNTELPVVGIAGRKGFSTVQIEKSLMNQERGFGRRLLQILESHGISFEHTPTSIDSMSVIMEEDELLGRREAVIDEIQRVLQPDRVEILDGLAMIATVGQGMAHTVGIAGRLFEALAAAGVNIRMINQGASEINIITGVMNEDYEAAIRAIYGAFVPAA
jgi:aspartate kinase